MWDNITSAGAWVGRNANITNLKISFLSLDGKSCDCRSERGEENTERRAFFTLAGFRSFYRRRGQQKFRQPFAAGREENLYCTGDWVTLDENGNYLFVGRKDHMIKTRGYRVELG